MSKPTEKEQLYSRQLYLWDQSGQNKIESSHVCLLNANSVGTEILKNLVLPGLAKYTLVDGKKVTKRDTGNNFYVKTSDIGKSRAKVTSNYLQIHNKFVQGNFLEKESAELIEENIEFFEQFDMIIASRLPEDAVLKLSKKCWEKDIPLVIVRTNGLIGYLRIMKKEHCVIDRKEEEVHEDLRMNAPFEELIEHCNSIKMEELDDDLYGHVPYLVILVKLMEQWKKDHEGKPPKTREEKKKFKDIIYNMRRSDEANFSEAYLNAWKAWNSYMIPDNIDEIFDDKNIEVTKESTPFWLVGAALKDFVANEGKGTLPVVGTIPDMTADTKSFITLQKIYQKKAEKDAICIHEKVKKMLEKFDRNPEEVPLKYVKFYCKNMMQVWFTRYPNIEQEFDPKTSKIKSLESEFANESNNHIFYLVFRAVEAFNKEHGYYPGESNEKVESDYLLLKKEAVKICELYKLNPEIMTDKYLKGFCRFGHSELHNVSAFMGGITAQEVIKLITEQRQPMSNTFIYNAVNATTTTFKI